MKDQITKQAIKYIDKGLQQCSQKIAKEVLKF